MNTQIDTVPVIALIDPEGPAKTVVNLATVSAPDFFEDGRAYWIGTDAVVSCEISSLDWMSEQPIQTCEHAAAVAALGGWHARTGHTTQYAGIGCEALIDTTKAVEAAPLKHKVEFVAWRLVQDVLIDA